MQLPCYCLLPAIAIAKKHQEQVLKPQPQNKPNRSEAKTPDKKSPIINLVDSVAPRRIVLCIKDGAATFEGISLKLAQIYGGKLTEVFKLNALKPTGVPIHSYSTHKAPYFFEAGMPVSKRPTKLLPGVTVKDIPADSVIMAHFYGPYDLLNVGYDAVKEWMKDHKKRSTGTPYEIYIGDPIDNKGKPVDPYKVQTDTVFPRR